MASHPFTLESSFGMMGNKFFSTMSPGNRTLSSSTKISMSPLVWAAPSQNRRAVTPPRSSFISRSKRISGVRNLTSWSRSLFWADIFRKASRCAATLLFISSCCKASRRMTVFAGGVFGVVMRVREVQIGTFRKFLRNAHDGGAIALTESRVDHQRTVVSDDNPDVGKSRQRVYVLGHVRQGVF